MGIKKVTRDDGPAMELDGWDDPEKQMLRMEDEDEEPTVDESGQLGILQRLDEILAGYTGPERKMFWLIFVDGLSIAAAGRETAVGGDVHSKFKKMMETVKEHMDI
jgi:hypothetical protein